MLTKLFKNRRGITLAEVAIAMAVVTIVTVSALSIIVSSTQTTTRAICKTEAQYFAADALECFRASKDTTDFETAMTFRGGFAECDGTNCQHAANGYNYHYASQAYDFNAYVKVDYESARPTFNILILDGDGEEITKFDFEKGVN